MANNIVSLDEFLRNRTEHNENAFRDWLLTFAKRIAVSSYEPECPYPLSFQVICAGWASYLEHPKMTGWWLAGVVPIVECCRDTVRISFVSGFADKIDGEYQTVAELELCRTLRTWSNEDDFVMGFGKALNSYDGQSVLMQALPFISMLKFAKRDMGFCLDSITQEGDLITVVIAALTEQMTIRFHFNQARISLEKLKLDVERQERRTGVSLNVDWNTFNRDTEWDKE